MKKSTLAFIAGATLLLIHGAYALWGWLGVGGVIVAAALFFLTARTIYWRRLRRVRQATRKLNRDEREVMYSFAGLDAEARRDMEKVIQAERKSAHNRR